MKIKIIYTYGGIDAPNQDREKSNPNNVVGLAFADAVSAEKFARSSEWPYWIHSLVCGDTIVANPSRSNECAHGASPFSARGLTRYKIGA